MHKTGTSSIQASLYGSPAGPGYRYADLGRANHSAIICAAMQPGQSDGLGGSPALAQLRRELHANAAATIVISGEGICRLDADQLRALRDVLSEYVDSVKVVAYVRPPLGYIESAFQQRLKSNDLDLMDALDSYPRYRMRFEKFDRVFGRENVELWKFDPHGFPLNCVVRDFCSRLEIDLPAERIVRVNDGLSRQAIALLYAYRKFGRNGADPILSKRIERYLVDRLTEVRGPKLRFAVAMLGSVLEDNAADIQWMEDRLGASLAEEICDEPTAIATEEDLFQYDPAALIWLAEQLGSMDPTGELATDAPQVASRMRLLVDKLAMETVGRAVFSGLDDGGAEEPSLRQRVLNAMQASPNVLGDLPERNATALVREVLRQIAREIDAMDEGVLDVAGLGQFRVVRAERSKGSEVSRNRVIFRTLEVRHPKASVDDSGSGRAG